MAVIELVGMGSPLLVGDDVLQSSSIIITIKTFVYNTLRHDSRSLRALGRRSHRGALRHAATKLQRRRRARSWTSVQDESGTGCKVREEPAPCLITAQRLAERDGHVKGNPCTFISLPEAQCQEACTELISSGPLVWSQLQRHSLVLVF